MNAASDPIIDFIEFYTGELPDVRRHLSKSSGRSDPISRPSWEELASAVRRESSTDPATWLRIFERIAMHPDLPDDYAAPVFDGLVAHLLYRSGRIAVPPDVQPAVPLPSKDRIARCILASLERRPLFLDDGRRVADAVLAVCETPAACEQSTLLVFWLTRLAAHPDPAVADFGTTATQDARRRDIAVDVPASVHTSVRGKAAEGAIRLAARRYRRKDPVDPLLNTLLVRYATDLHPGVRIALLGRLSALARHDAATAWKLYGLACHSLREFGCDRASDPSGRDRLWASVEPFLRTQYAPRRAAVLSALGKKPRTAAVDGGGWGKTLTEAYLSGDVSCKRWIEDLANIAREEAWTRAFDLLDDGLDSLRQRDMSRKGLLTLAAHPLAIPCLLERLPAFLPVRTTDFVDIAVEMTYRFIMNFDGSNRPYNLFWLYRWIAELARKAPVMAGRMRADLMNAIRRTDGSERIWQAKMYACVLSGWPEQDAGERKQGR